MKFYYLPHPCGFTSFSKNHLTLYNEKQEAKFLGEVTDDEVRIWLRYPQQIKSIQANIQAYQETKNKTFHELGYLEPYWTIT